jgi:hypothetical protein
MRNRVTLELTFDSEAWADLTADERALWVNEAVDAVSNYAQVSAVRTDTTDEENA